MNPVAWIRKSFTRQFTLMLLVSSCAVTSVYAYIDYKKEIAQFQSLMEGQAEYLTRTLTLVIANDVRYRKHYEMWNRLNDIYDYQVKAVSGGALFGIRDIAVVDLQGQVMAHTHPREYPLSRLYKHPNYPDIGKEAMSASAPVKRASVQKNMLVLAMPVRFGGEVLGAVVVDFDTSALSVIQHRLFTTYLLYMLAMIVLVSIISIILARIMTKPVHDAVGSLSSLGDGQLELPSLLNRSDELYQLGAAIKSADRRIYEGSRALEARTREVQKLNSELEQRVAERTAELVLANKELEAFSYSVSHDLRAPLRSIDGFSVALIEDSQDSLNDASRRHLERIRTAAQRMGNLIDDLLMLSRISRYDISYDDVDLSTLAREIKEAMEEQEPDVHVEFTIAENLHVKGDAHLLRIALENLIGNAWKYSSKQVNPHIVVDCEAQDAQTVFFVRDNGAGFDMKYVDKLFGVFQRLHGSDFEGTGVGLATVERIITRHGGKIWADAALDKGATFYFSLSAG